MNRANDVGELKSKQVSFISRLGTRGHDKRKGRQELGQMDARFEKG